MTSIGLRRNGHETIFAVYTRRSHTVVGGTQLPRTWAHVRCCLWDWNVRFGSSADICTAIGHVHFIPENGHLLRTSPCLLWAKSGYGDALLRKAVM